MPLRDGCSRAVHSENIAILRHEGLPEDQAVAIAFKKAKLYAKAHHKRGWWERRKKRGKKKRSMKGAKRSTVKTVKPTSLRSASQKRRR